jgi:HipA-like protein
LNKINCGKIEFNKNSAIFSYSSEYDFEKNGTLSLRMNDFHKEYKNEINTFLKNLMSENKKQILFNSKLYHYDENDLYSYFINFGLDCAGSIQFVPIGEEGKIFKEEKLTEISESAIIEEFSSLQTEGITKTLYREHFSLSGVQNKIALIKKENK